MSPLCLRCGAPRSNAFRCEYCGVLFEGATAAEGPRDLPPAFHAALAKDDLIEAIKLFRQTRGIGLKEARDAVLAMKKR